MASSSDGMPILTQMSDLSTIANPLSSAGDMKFYLQTLLDSKEKQLQQAGTLGQRVLAQQMELEERIRQLQEIEADKSDDDEIDTQAREKYRELADTLVTWDAENAQLSSVFGGSKRFANGKAPSPSVPFTELPREEPERSKTSVGASAAQSRRAKNAAHRADDVEFAFEIGSGLLTEVRRLQSLLGERDKAIQDMKEEKDDLEKTVENLRTALRQQEQSADKFKEENWNLEVTLQELRTQLGDIQASNQRLESEQKRLTKQLAAARDAGDQHKNEAERLQNVIEEMKAKHETDIAHARRHAAGLARDKSDLQQSLDAMKAEAARAARRFPRYGSPLTPNGAAGSDFIVTPAGGDDKDSDLFTGGASTNRRKLDTSALFNSLDGELGSDYADSPEPSPVKQPFLAANHPSNEIEALQQRLAHAQRQINTLKGSLQREKQLKMEYRSRLQASPVAAAADEPDVVEADEAEEAEGISASKPRRRLTPFKVGARSGGAGRGRSRANMSLIEKLGMAAHSPGSEYPDDDDQDDDEPPPVPPIPIKFSQAEEDEDDPFASKTDSQDVEDEEAKEEISRSPSPLEPPSNRTSIDGMDPAFANVLRRVPSNGSSYAGSPLRQSVLGSAHGRRSVGRRPRGGVPYKEARPPSLVGPPGVLSAELGVGIEGSPLKNREQLEDVQEKAYQDVETIEIGCQTEEVPEPAPTTAVETAEMGVQAKPVVEPVPEVVTSEQSTQTEAEVVTVVEKADMATQSEVEVAVRPALVDVNIGTEPVLQAKPVPAPILIQTETQTQSVSLVGAGIQTDLPSFRDEQVSRRATITQHDVSFGHSSGDTTVTRRDFLVEAVESDYEEEDGDETETGADTETDMDDYQDARQSISMFSPSGTESRDDFHSILTMTDNDFSESEDDGESIKASRLSSTHHLNSSVASSIGLQQDRPSSYYAALAPPAKEYENVGVSADFQPEPERIVERVVERVVVKEVVEVPAPLPPKPETSEISIQTDEWIPPLPPPPPAPPAPITISTSVQTAPVLTLPSGSTPGLYRVGSSGQQFQFILPPTPSAPSSGQGSASPALSAPISSSAPSSNALRDSGVNLSRTRTAASDRRPSIESAMSAAEERPRVSSAAGLLAAVDKSKPPTMIVPPPPRLPPPTNMPPPSFIPERRIPTSSTGSYDIPPPRPSSPPPPELVQRATTPTFGSVLNVPGGKAIHSLRHGASMPASPSAGIRQPPSTSSFRSATPLHGPHSVASSGNLQSLNVVRERRQFSTTSLVSERSVPSPRSSMSSDQVPYHNAVGPEPSTPNKTADITPRATGTSTDPAVIHAITQTMIGEFLYKYTRRAIGKGHGERRHRRFFWVHPYTKTLYWSSADPTSTNVSESSAKSAYIEGVRSVLDPNPMPPGLYQHSVIISTPQREMKITAPTKERHDIWFNALKYLLSRPTAATMTSPGNATVVPQSPASGGDFTDDERRHVGSSPQSQRSGRSLRNTEIWNVTPRGQRSRSQLSVGGSVGKRSGTPAAEYLRWNGPESPYSPTKSFVEVANRDDEELDFELHDNSLSDDGFEGLENVRACCDGRHTVGHSGAHHHHHHHHHHHADQFQPLDNLHLEPARQESAPIRPVSPSAWSFRSRTGSAHSHEGGGGGIFGWGRGEDGKLRFGSRRSTKTALVNDQ